MHGKVLPGLSTGLEIASFLKNGGRLIKQSKSVWFFSALYVIGALQPSLQRMIPSPKLLSFAASLTASMLMLISFIAQLYITYCLASQIPFTLGDPWRAIQKFAYRIIGVLFMFLLITVPCLCLTLLLAQKRSSSVSEVAKILLLVGLSILTPFWFFTCTEIVARNVPTLSGLKAGLTLYSQHFLSSAGIALILAILGWTVIILLEEAQAAGGPFSLILQAIWQFFWFPFSTATFVMAYTKWQSEPSETFTSGASKPPIP